MNEFDEYKAKRTGVNALPGGGRLNFGCQDAAWIAQILRRRYDGALNEALPESFVGLLQELDRKTDADH